MSSLNTGVNYVQFQNAEIKIIDVNGKQVHPAIIHNSDSYVIKRDDLAAGIYLVQIKTDKGTAAKKLLSNK